MKLTEEELRHVVFLAEVVLDGDKRSMMEETLQCLLYIVKSLRVADLPEDVSEEIRILIGRMETNLRQENDRLQEIKFNLLAPKLRRPL